MKNKLTSIFYILFFIRITYPSFAIDKDADKIIEKYLKAIGGRKNWEKVNNIKIFSHDKNADEFVTMTIIIRGKGLYEEHVLEQGTPTLTIVNNKEGWRVRNGFYKREKDQFIPVANDDFLDYHFISKMPWNLLNYKKEGIETVSGGQLYVDGILVNEVRLEKYGQYLASYFFDKKNDYLVKVVFGNREINYDDYRVIKKLKYPYYNEELLLKFKVPGTNYPVKIKNVVDNVSFNIDTQNYQLEKPSN